MMAPEQAMEYVRSLLWRVLVARIRHDTAALAALQLELNCAGYLMSPADLITICDEMDVVTAAIVKTP